MLEQLSSLGDVKYLRVPYSQRKRKNLGYGFVVFQQEAVADKLASNKIVIMIDDKIISFEKFDIGKYKTKSWRPIDNSLSDGSCPE